MEGVEVEAAEECAVAFYIMGFRRRTRSSCTAGEEFAPSMPTRVLTAAEVPAAQTKYPHEGEGFSAAACVSTLRGVVLEHTESQMCEVLLVATRPLSEAAWVARSMATLEPHLHLQTQELVAEEQGAACAARMISVRHKQLDEWYDSQMRNTTAATAAGTSKEYVAAALWTEGYFDAYRIASGGCMHHLDTRAWCMPLGALERLRIEESRASAALRKLVCESGRLHRQLWHHHHHHRWPDTVVNAYRRGSLHQTLVVLVIIPMLMRPPDGADEEDGGSTPQPEPTSSWHLMQEEEEEEVVGEASYHRLETTQWEARGMELMHEMGLLRERINELRTVLMRQAELERPVASSSTQRQPPAASVSPPANKRPRCTAVPPPCI
jgi:hypothetical protein